MVRVHKYVNYGVSAALVGGMQYVFAPTRGIPYYAIGALISYNTSNPLDDRAYAFALEAFNLGLWQNLVIANIQPVFYAARLYFSDYMLGRSIGEYMVSLGYSDNMTRVLTCSAIALATSVQNPSRHDKYNKSSLMNSKPAQCLIVGSNIFAHYYFEPKVENLPKIFLSTLLINFAYEYIPKYLREQQSTKGKSPNSSFLSLLFSSSIRSAINTTSIGLVNAANFDTTSVLGKVAINTISSNISSLVGHVIDPISTRSGGVGIRS